MFKRPRKQQNLSELGFFDIPDVSNMDDEDIGLSDNDADLEAELAAITGGTLKPKPRKPAPVPSSNLDAMIAESLKDIPSDEELSGDDEDPELMNELKALALDDDEPTTTPLRSTRPAPPPPSAGASPENSTVKLLQERIANYELAEANAKANNEASRARRFSRGLKTLIDLLKQAKSGKAINIDDIPPAVVVAKPAPTPKVLTPSEPAASEPQSDHAQTLTPQSPPDSLPTKTAEETQDSTTNRTDESKVSEKQQGLLRILKRKEELKAAALSCKQSGDRALALEFLKVHKQFDIVVEAYKNGQSMDLSELPTIDSITAEFRSQQRTAESVQKSTESSPSSESSGLIVASSLEEALKQRLAGFQEQERKSKEQGNESKARRMGRIAKQYQDAIKLHAAGKPVPIDDLPPLAGYAPFPTQKVAPPKVTPKPSPTRSASHGPSPPGSASGTPTSGVSRQQKQLVLLLRRQKEFKEAALNAKKTGNIEQAKEYLRKAIGFNTLIEAAKNGQPVDLKSIPSLTKVQKEIDDNFDMVTPEDCSPPEEPSSILDEDLLSTLHHQLTAQLKLCLDNRDHYTAMGNVAEAKRFEGLAVSVKQDLDVIALAKRTSSDPPEFHYLNRQFSVVQCNTDLNENDLELTIIRGVSYNVPNPREVDTYVKFEFPYPQEAPVVHRTDLVKDTNSPQYNATFPLTINRGARACQRLFKRHAIKFEVYSKGGACAEWRVCCSGWFSRDQLLGVATVRLAPLETEVTLHDAFPLMEGRRPAGGSLEVRLRLRSPILQPRVVTTAHKWLELK